MLMRVGLRLMRVKLIINRNWAKVNESEVNN